MAAAHYHLDNLTIIIDNNGLQIDGTNDEVMSLGDLPAKLRAFGLDLHEIDGHDMDTIEAALSAPPSPASPSASWPTPSRARVSPSWRTRWAGTARPPTRSSASRL